MIFAALVEVFLLCLIIQYAWKWPQTLRNSIESIAVNTTK